MSAENFIFVDFSAGKVDGSDCQPRNMCYSENILSLDSKPNRKLLFDENKEKFPNPWLVYTLKHLVNFKEQKLHEDKIFDGQL